MSLFKEYRNKILGITESVKEYSSGTGYTAKVISKGGKHVAKFFHNGEYMKAADYEHPDADDVHEFAQDEMEVRRKEKVNEAFKEVPTHLGSGKPNPNHPAYETHKAKYDAEVKANKEPREKTPKFVPSEKVSLHHYFSAFDSVPDLDPHDVISNLSKKLGISHEETEKGLDRHAKNNGNKKGYQDEYFKMVKDYKAGLYEETIDESKRKPQGNKESEDPISDSTKENFREHPNRVRNQMGQTTGKLEIIAKILAGK